MQMSSLFSCRSMVRAVNKERNAGFLGTGVALMKSMRFKKSLKSHAKRGQISVTGSAIS